MTRIIGAVIALFFFSSVSFAFGIPYRVESLEKAKSLQSQDQSKHILVFYTVPSN